MICGLEGRLEQCVGMNVLGLKHVKLGFRM